MREITINKTNKTTVKITSPWLSVTEAATYLNISRAEFFQKVRDAMPYKGYGHARRYHINELDKYHEAKNEKEKK